jgi:hypothetical protein
MLSVERAKFPSEVAFGSPARGFTRRASALIVGVPRRQRFCHDPTLKRPRAGEKKGIFWPVPLYPWRLALNLNGY